jgi:hypothetical protein
MTPDMFRTLFPDREIPRRGYGSWWLSSNLGMACDILTSRVKQGLQLFFSLCSDSTRRHSQRKLHGRKTKGMQSR